MKRKIVKNWEKLALGGSVGVLLAYVLLGMVMASTDPVHGQASLTLRNITELHQSSDKPEMIALHSRKRIETAFGAATEAVPAPEWVFYKRTTVEVNERLVQEKATGPDPAFKKPSLVAVTADVGAVKMSWDDALGNNIKTVGYWVHRRKKGDKNFEKAAGEPVTDRAYMDGEVQPKTAYEYAVSAIADEKDEKFAEAVKRGLFKADGISAPSDPMPVVTLGVLGLALKIVSEQPPANSDEEPVRIARVTVKRFVNGEWMEKDYSVRKGEKIGKPEKVRKDGKPFDVIFTTNFEVQEIAKEEVTFKVPQQVKKFDPATGQLMGVETVMREVKKNAWVLTYKDDEGKKQKVAQDEPKPALKPAPKDPKKDGETK